MVRGCWIVSIAVGVAVVFLVIWNWPQGTPQPPDPAPPGDPWFEDVTDKVGLSFVHECGPVGDYFMPQQVGSGAAFFDFDKDGRLDILLLQNAGPNSTSTNQLFRQRPDGTFVDVTKGSGLDFAGHNMGVAIGDVNNDGWPDVLITQYTGVKLLINNGGDGTFTDVTAESGLTNPSWGTSAAFVDFNRDGWLDLVVVCYVDYDPTWPCTGSRGKRDYCAPKTFKGRVSRLFRNRGADEAGPTRVRFEDVTIKSGLGRIPGPGLGVVCADFNGDGWPDLLIANDGEPNTLWINQKGETFREEGSRRGLACNQMGYAQAGMGIAIGDVDGDGLFDIFVTHLAEESHTLWRQGPRGLFRDQTGNSGILQTAWRGTGFGTVLADFNNDGHLDLAIANGAVFAQTHVTDDSLGPFWSAYGQRNQLLRNDGTGRFHDISNDNPPLCGKNNVARGLAYGDFDKDGGLDLLVTTIAGRARLFRNVAPRGHWLKVHALDPHKRDALGAEVFLHAGDRKWVRQLHSAHSYLCSSEPCAHFGLGDVSTVDRIEVLWPDGAREAFFPAAGVDRRIDLLQGSGKALTP